MVSSSHLRKYKTLGLVCGSDKRPADWLVDECEFALFFATSLAIAYACGQRG
jgi:hypothetical protein